MTSDDVRRDVERGDVKLATAKLIEYFSVRSDSADYANEARVLASRATTLDRDVRQGRIADSSANAQRNQIAFAILELLDDAGANAQTAAESVFVSYRRDGGAEVARAVSVALKVRGLGVILDVEDLRAGPFDSELLTRIDETTAVVLILSKGSLDCRTDSTSWVRAEISHALRTGKRVVPVRMPAFVMPEDLPDDLQQLPLQNSVNYSHEYFDASIDRIIELLRS